MKNAKMAVTLRIKGTQYYSSETLLSKGMIKKGGQINLITEPSNSHDCNAVAIYLKHNNEKLGYISHSVSRKYSRLVESGLITEAIICSISQPDKYGLDIRVKVTYIDSLAEEIRQQSKSSVAQKSSRIYGYFSQHNTYETPKNESRTPVASETARSSPNSAYKNSTSGNSCCLGILVLLVASQSCCLEIRPKAWRVNK